MALATGSGTTATAAEDYTLPAALTIAAGQTTATANVTLVNDDRVEDSEDLALTATVSGLTVTGVKLTITDDDAEAAKIAFGSDAAATMKYTASVAEDAGTLNVPVTVSHLPSASTTFAVEVLDTGTAAEGTDYSIAMKTVTFGPTDTDRTKNISIAITDDSVLEPDETIELKIAAADQTANDLGDHIRARRERRTGHGHPRERRAAARAHRPDGDGGRREAGPVVDGADAAVGRVAGRLRRALHVLVHGGGRRGRVRQRPVGGLGGRVPQRHGPRARDHRTGQRHGVPAACAGGERGRRQRLADRHGYAGGRGHYRADGEFRGGGRGVADGHLQREPGRGGEPGEQRLRGEEDPGPRAASRRSRSAVRRPSAGTR